MTNMRILNIKFEFLYCQ